MDARMKGLVRDVLDEVGLIRSGKARMPKSLAEAKGDLEDASFIAKRLHQFGPSFSDKELEQLGLAIIGLNDATEETLDQLGEFEKARHQETVDGFTEKHYKQFRTAATRQARARARLTIAALARKGFSLDQIQWGVLNHGKDFTPPGQFPRKLKNVKGQFVVRLSPGRRKPR